MRSFRRLACVLALTLPVLPAAFGQVSSSSSSTQAQPPSGETQGEVTVQARIRQRREQRRQAAIRAAYDHLYDAYGGVGYLRFSPGKYLQQLTFYAWDFGITRYSSERLGINLEGRGYFGTAYVGLNKYGLTRPAISQYDVLAGPSYRVYVQPKYSVALRAMGGWSYGNFSGDTNGLGGTTLGLYPDGNSFAIDASVLGEYNVSPKFALRLAPEYFLTGFGSTLQASRGFNGGFVFRWGKL